MKFRTRHAVGLGLSLVAMATGEALAQQQYQNYPAVAAPAESTARVETAPIDSNPPDRFLVPTVLEPTRRVTIMAMGDGIVRALVAPLGGTVKEGQEIVQLDSAEATAHLRIAQAEAREAEAKLSTATVADGAVAKAQVEVAQTKVELAQMEVGRCSLRAPFPGRIISYPISAGQYVSKGTVLAELADISSLRMLVPVNRTAVKEGATLDVLWRGEDARREDPDDPAAARQLLAPPRAGLALGGRVGGGPQRQEDV